MQYSDFGKFLRLKRESLKPKPSLNKFAIDVDIEPATLSRIENCKQGIKLSDVGKVAFGFNMLASELLKEYEKTKLDILYQQHLQQKLILPMRPYLSLCSYPIRLPNHPLGQIHI